ncbi:MAG TPA: FAD-dependent oxidoreductase [Chloroflexota bacterium]
MRDARRSFAATRFTSYWLDDPRRPEPSEALVHSTACDLAVVGGGFTGLWTALLAKERDPNRNVVLVESREIGWAATGRNGGFCLASLTHGLANGLERFPTEIERLEMLGHENFEGLQQTLARYNIDCDFEPTGTLNVALEPYQMAELREWMPTAARYGEDVLLLDQDQVRAEVASPTYLGGVWTRNGAAVLHPARLAWGLKAACLSLGVRIHEHSPVTGMERDGCSVRLTTPYGQVTARSVALATNAFSPLLRRIANYIVPVYDYVLVTEPLTEPQMNSIGWKHRQGLGDNGNQFHYYRLTADNRILWGGYDAVYHYKNGLRDELDNRPESFLKLAGHFFTTFPQLEGIRFTHAWGGAIDTCSRFCVFWGQAMGGKVAYAAGYTGLGVGASRFGAAVLLDLLSGRETELTALQFVKSKPVPFPPEPLRYLGIQLTRWSLDQADRHQGRRNAWLRALDRLGLGYDS